MTNISGLKPTGTTGMEAGQRALDTTDALLKAIQKELGGDQVPETSPDTPEELRTGLDAALEDVERLAREYELELARRAELARISQLRQEAITKALSACPMLFEQT